MDGRAVGPPLLLLLLAGAQARGEQLLRDFYDTGFLLLAEEPENPKCFSRTLEDLTCFWEEGAGEANATFRFYYQLEKDPEKSCNLTSQTMAGNSTRYICTFPLVDVVSFAVLRVRVMQGNGSAALYSRSLQVNDVVLLDAPGNLTVRETEQLGQLFISWQAPPLDYLDDSIQYEVSVASASNTSSAKVGILAGRTDCTVANVKEQTEYSIAVRAKPDGVSFGGYWSAWSQPVSLLTSPRDLDPLILALILILALLLLLIGTVLLLHHRRFLKQKIWPVIPNPANHFEGLFDMHKGNFQRWLGHSNTYLWWSPRLYAAEDVAASVEILSELGQAQLRLPVREDAARRVPSLQSGADERGSGPPVQARPPPLLKDSYVALDESFPSRGAAGDGGAYGAEAASENRAPRQTPEGSTVGRQREGDDGEPGSSPSTGMPSPSPGQSSSSSFEYTVFDPTADTLSPRARAPCSHPKYAYLLVSDSGVATDYSTTSPDPSKPQRGHYSNFYENTPTYAIYSQC